MKDKEELRIAYFVLESQVNTNGEYNALCAIEGKKGYYYTDWYWGDNLEVAEKIAKDKNLAMGITSDEAMKIVLSTMRS